MTKEGHAHTISSGGMCPPCAQSAQTDAMEVDEETPHSSADDTSEVTSNSTADSMPSLVTSSSTADSMPSLVMHTHDRCHVHEFWRRLEPITQHAERQARMEWMRLCDIEVSVAILARYKNLWSRMRDAGKMQEVD